jgi:predicted dehydrogenase
MTSKKINWGVLGCAGIAEKHVIPALLQADNAVLYGIASRSDSERLHQFEEKFRPLHSYTSYEALLSDPSIDAVYIPLPNSLHAEWVKKAAAAKKNVLCEKPLVSMHLKSSPCRRLATRMGLAHGSLCHRHSPLTRTLDTLIQSGQIGDLRLIEAYFCYNLQDLDNVRLKSDLKGARPTMLAVLHIDLIAHLMGGLLIL